MKLTPVRALIGSLIALFTLTGCQFSVSGHGTLTDVASKKSQAIAVDVHSRNKGQECEVSITLSDEQGGELYSTRTDAVVDARDGSLAIDTSKSDCEPE